MSFLDFFLTQQLTLWVLTGVDGYNKPTFAAPVQRACRWEDRTTKLQRADGQEILSHSRIFLAEAVKLGDFIALGVVAGSDPMQIPSARAVLQYSETPSLDGSDFERKAFL